MKLIINGSNSKGNNYVLVSDSGEKLIIEAGVKLMELKQSLNFKIENISGLLVSHEHL
jgi:phosphoribosyl 1,2-cyclic phosphodiesterase